MQKLKVKSPRSDYIYYFSIHDNGDGTRTLTAESQWLGAKNPNDLQRRWKVTLDEQGLSRLARLLHLSTLYEETLQ